MSDVGAVAVYGVLVIMFGIPMVMPNVSSDALTQGMIVVLGYLVLLNGE